MTDPLSQPLVTCRWGPHRNEIEQYGQGQAPAAQMSPDNAKQTAQQYADQYLKGFSVDKVLPFTGMGGMTMFSVELKGPNNELRTLHVNPWGQVMPFGGPWHRG